MGQDAPQPKPKENVGGFYKMKDQLANQVGETANWAGEKIGSVGTCTHSFQIRVSFGKIRIFGSAKKKKKFAC